jgi:hypothetical protein
VIQTATAIATMACAVACSAQVIAVEGKQNDCLYVLKKLER